MKHSRWWYKVDLFIAVSIAAFAIWAGVIFVQLSNEKRDHIATSSDNSGQYFYISDFQLP